MKKIIVVTFICTIIVLLNNCNSIVDSTLQQLNKDFNSPQVNKDTPEPTDSLLFKMLSTKNAAKLTSLLRSINGSDVSEFNRSYKRWKHTWNTPLLLTASNPAECFKSLEYLEFKQLCTTMKRQAALLLMSKCLEGDELAGKAACRMKLVDADGSIMKQTRMNSPHGTISEDGNFLTESAVNGWVRFIENVLNEEF